MNKSDELCWQTLTQIGEMIRSGQVTSVAVTEMMLARIERVDRQYHSYFTVMTEHAMQQARAADEAIAAGQHIGPLHGVPIAVKDLCDTAAAATSGGMMIHKNRVPDTDATVVARLANAGAVLLGKLAMTEGALSTHHPDVTMPVNPWGADYTVGSSSSGSGVATSIGLCYGSLGSDTMGSIRFPSTMCGLTGLKPTWGRVSRAGVMDLAPTMDHVGPMTRSAADCAAMLSAIAGSDANDPTSASEPVPNYIDALTDRLDGVRIGIDRDLISSNAEAEVTEVIEQAAAVMAQLGAQILDIKYPALDQIVLDGLDLCFAEGARTHEPTFPSRKDEYGPVLASQLEKGREIDDAKIAQIRERREVFAGEVAGVFRSVDLVLFPAMNRAAPTLTDMATQAITSDSRVSRLLFTSPIDMSRNPSLTLPGGFGKAGVPIGFQIVGDLFDEAGTLAAGHAYQQVTDWHQRHPELSA
jgi:amidase